jgi:hypothetical protein
MATLCFKVPIFLKKDVLKKQGEIFKKIKFIKKILKSVF